MDYGTQLCSDTLAATARKRASETGVTHHVIHISQGRGKGFLRIIPSPINYTAEGQAGDVTVLFTAEPKITVERQ